MQPVCSAVNTSQGNSDEFKHCLNKLQGANFEKLKMDLPRQFSDGSLFERRKERDLIMIEE